MDHPWRGDRPHKLEAAQVVPGALEQALAPAEELIVPALDAPLIMPAPANGSASLFPRPITGKW
jgi:hypothetical protein